MALIRNIRSGDDEESMEDNREEELDMDPSIVEWCKNEGLSKKTLQVLKAEEFTDLDVVGFLTRETVKELPLSLAQRLILGKALIKLQQIRKSGDNGPPGDNISSKNNAGDQEKVEEVKNEDPVESADELNDEKKPLLRRRAPREKEGVKTEKRVVDFARVLRKRSTSFTEGLSPRVAEDLDAKRPLPRVRLMKVSADTPPSSGKATPTSPTMQVS